jgi:FkbM family methyltransferase
MRWLDTKLVKQLPGFKATIVLEVSQNNPFHYVSKDVFDAYLVLDPTCKHFQNNVYVFPRPLEVAFYPIAEHNVGEVPVIGTFGLSFAEKGFDEVVKAVNEEFEAATIRINVPNSVNITPQGVNDFKALLSSFNLKDKIKVELSDHYFSKEELINWCAQNTLNIFLYNRLTESGLSTTTDQAIVSCRPLAISTNPTFRHIHKYIKPYPYLSLKKSIESTIPLVKKMQEDWSPLSFVLKFEAVLKENNVTFNGLTNANKTKLPITNKSFIKQFTPPILLKAWHELRATLNRNNATAKEATVLRPFVHQVLQSYSQFQEDLLIDLLLNRKKDGVYVDIGANDPFFNSNTERFYLRGWRGINIEPCLSAFNKIAENREFDINLNIAVSEESGKLLFYQIGNDSSLSTLDNRKAVKMAETYKLKLISSMIDVMPVSKILDAYLSNRHIDFMSVDTQGHDLTVLKSNDWYKYRPTLVMVNSDIDSRKIIMFMDSQNYLYIFSNHVNALFIDKMTPDQNILDINSLNS